MAIIKRPGKPNRKTAGGVGDIYIDILTKTKYKCTFAYSAHGNVGDYEWRLLEDEIVEEEVVEEVKPVVEETPVVEEEVVETPVEEVKEEPVVEESTVETQAEEVKPKSSKKSNRTNYNSQYNKKK